MIKSPNQRNALLCFLHLYVISYVYLFIFTSQFSPLEGIYKSGVLWICKSFFQQQVEYIRMTGSGDTTLDYWVVAVNTSLAAVAALVVLLADKKKAYI